MVSTGSRRGQALIEVTIFSIVLLVAIFAGLAILGTFKKELKHDFVSKSSISVPPAPEDSSLNSYVVKFEEKNMKSLEDHLSETGWSEESKIKIPDGLVILLTREDKRMAVFSQKGRRFGIYY